MKNILVTGGTRGLGLAITKRLSEDGYSVISTGRNPSSELEQYIRDREGKVHFAKLNLLTDNLHDFVRGITKTYGQIYGLINNAAVGIDGVLATMHDSQISEILTVNTYGTILLTKYAVRSMLVVGEGAIVNISSVIAQSGFNGLSVYAASKSALIGFTKSLARELGDANITVNAVAPGYMETDMTSAMDDEKLQKIRRRSPMRKFATPADVANGVAFLLSSAAKSINGTTLTIDYGSSV